MRCFAFCFTASCSNADLTRPAENHDFVGLFACFEGDENAAAAG